MLKNALVIHKINTYCQHIINHNIKQCIKNIGLLITIFVLCFSVFTYAFKAQGVIKAAWEYDKYGYTQPEPGYPIKGIATKYGFNEDWEKYLGPAAIKAGKALNLDPIIIGAWVYSEGINSAFTSNCSDDLATINKPCYDNNWQIGYGFRPFDGWINPSKPHRVLHKALEAMHPGKSIHDIIVDVINRSKTKYDEVVAKYSEKTVKTWPFLWEPKIITNPAIENVPENITVEELWSKGVSPSTTSLYRQLLFVLLMDDEISAYCEGYVLRTYANSSKGMAKAMAWFTSPEEFAQALDYVSKLGLPTSSGSSCVENLSYEIYAIVSETTFYDSVDCDPNAAGGVGVSPDGFVFPQKTTKAQLKKYGNGNWIKCEFGINEMTNGSKDNPDNIANYPGARACHHDYLAADIFNETGTPVVAPRPGIITSISESSSGNNGLMIHLYSDKNLGGDGLWYYFAHSLPGSGKVKKGDVVQAGDELAAQGTDQDAQGTPAHTHFDVSPSENYFHRGHDGTEGPLLDPGPALKASYQNLPEN